MKCVYIHKNPQTGEVFYVGKGSLDRAYQTASRNGYWHNYVKKHGGFDVEIVKQGLSNEESNALEKELIQHYGRRSFEGGTLVNLAIGGDGIAGLVAWNKGIKLPEKTCKKMSESRKGMKLKPHVIQSIKERMLGENNPQVKKYGKAKPKKYKLPYNNAKGEDNPTSKSIIQYTLAGDFVKKYGSSREVQANGFDRAAVLRCCKNKFSQHKGYKWGYETGL